MSLFSNKTPPNSEPVQQMRSLFQQMLDDFEEAHKRFEHAAYLCNAVMANIEKGLKYTERFRRELTRSIEETGGVVTPDPSSIEEQVRAYVAPHMQKVENEQSHNPTS